MKRIAIAAVLLGLLAGLAGTAGARTAHRPVGKQRVYRDCARDGRIDGHYRKRLLRRALREMPGDLAEYTSCPDAIHAALRRARHRRHGHHRHAHRHAHRHEHRHARELTPPSRR